MTKIGDTSEQLQSEIAQCRAALLYADEVSLLGPTTLLLASASRLTELRPEEALRVFVAVAPRYMAADPAVGEILEFVEQLRGLRSGGRLHGPARRQYRDLVDRTAEMLAPFSGEIGERAAGLLEEAGYSEIAAGIDAGVLSVDDSVRFDVTDFWTPTEETLNGLAERLNEILSSGETYPLFDQETSELVRLGVEEGVFAPVPMARRLGRDAAMASGLFDRLPSIQYATVPEVLQIRETLRAPLSRFRNGVRDLTGELSTLPEDPHFAAEVHDAWDQTVAPALDEIEESIATNSSLRDLAGWRDLGKRVIHDATAAPAMTGAVTSVSGLALGVGFGPVASVAGIGVGGAVNIARALTARGDATREAKSSTFYFLLGANQRFAAAAE